MRDDFSNGPGRQMKGDFSNGPGWVGKKEMSSVRAGPVPKKSVRADLYFEGTNDGVLCSYRPSEKALLLRMQEINSVCFL